jgi:hypothetical protein
MIENAELYEERERSGKGQSVGEEVEKWRVVEKMMKENRHVTPSLGDGGPSQDSWKMTEEHAREVFVKVEDAERVRTLGGEEAIPPLR